jgi:hypothetical protein
MVCVRNIVESVLDVMPTGAVHVEPKRLAVEAFLLIVPISYNGIAWQVPPTIASTTSSRSAMGKGASMSSMDRNHSTGAQHLLQT